MQKLLTWGSVLAAALVFSACQDATEPVALEGSGGSGNDTKCRGVVLDPENPVPEPLTGTFDNVVVPRGASCFLLNATVRGNVKALENSRLFIDGGIVRGNIEGDKASVVDVRRNTVHGNIHIIEAHDEIFFSALVFRTVLTKGNIQIEKGRFPLGDWNVVENELQKGNIKVEGNGATFFSSVQGSSVAQDVQVLKNFGPELKLVADNTIGGNLQCKENEEPFLVFGNVVGGNAEDQCAELGDMSGSVSARVQALREAALSGEFPRKKQK